MHPCFSEFEAALDRIAGRLPELPRTEAILTRLYFFCFGALNEDLNVVLAPYGLNTSSMVALLMLYTSPHHSANPSQLSVGMTSSRTNITRLVDELVEQGWVERRPCLDDRRKIFVALTDQGCAQVERALPAHWARLRTIWSALSPGEAALFSELLQKLWARLLELEPC